MSEPRKMTNEEAQAYLKHGGSLCPYCGSEEIEGESPDWEGYYFFETLSCTSCGGVWHNRYTLDNVGDNHSDTDFIYRDDGLLAACKLAWPLIAEYVQGEEGQRVADLLASEIAKAKGT